MSNASPGVGWTNRDIHRLVLATKAQDATAALRSVLPNLAVGCQCILLQNGVLSVADELQRQLGHELGTAPISAPAALEAVQKRGRGLEESQDTAAEVAGKRMRLYVASVTHGCYRDAPPSEARSPLRLGAPDPNAGALGVDHAGLGRITVGPLGPLLASSTSAAAAASHVFDHVSADTGCNADALFLQDLAASVPGLVLHPATDHGALLHELHAKLAANCAINPLTALLGCRNGALAELPHMRGLMREVCRELVDVFGADAFPAAGVNSGRELEAAEACEATEATSRATEGPPPTADGANADRGGAAKVAAVVASASDCGGGVAAGTGASELGGVGAAGLLVADAAPRAERTLYEWVLGVASATARNRSSMLQDVTAGRPTEVDYLNGWVIQVAGAKGVPAPVNATLHGLVKAKEAMTAAQ